MRHCCQPNHTMTLHMTDMYGAKVLTMYRPWNWNCCCCEIGNMCGKAHMEVYTGATRDDAAKIGSIGMPCCGGGFTPTFNIVDRNGDARAAVRGPCCCVSDLCGAKFEVTPAGGGDKIGDVKKLGGTSVKGGVQEMMTDADNFEISFPVDLDVDLKALLIGALLLLDYTFFESEGAVEINPFNGTCRFKCCDLFCCGTSPPRGPSARAREPTVAGCIIPCSCRCGGSTPDKGKGAPPRADDAAAPVAETITRGD